MELDSVYEDIAAFADDDEEVVVDRDGSVLFVRDGKEVSCEITLREGTPMVRFEDRELSYRRFLTHTLGRLDVFAERILSKRPSIDTFIDGPARVERVAGEMHEGRALALLDSECMEPPPFSARVAFITADAGHGKTALLREYQARQAHSFLGGKTGTLFWHVDLQGRQLLRLSEALMGDLGELRVAGLWMPGIIRLLQSRALILAIDGFDELAAEQGGADAIGALATLVDQLSGEGTIVAASRRTFFDTEDYLRRAGVIRRAITNPCEFDQLTLYPWTRDDSIQYLSSVRLDGTTFPTPTTTYNEVRDALGGEEAHPVLTRPFLLTQVSRALLRYDVSPHEFLRSGDEPFSGVATVVQAFVEREVQEKWRYADTGEPYLTVEQHMELLASVAEEMYRSQKDRLPVDVLETIATLLVDSWGVEPARRQQILQMVKMHVLLVVPSDGDSSARSFDHPEFRDYFIAWALRSRLEDMVRGRGSDELTRYLSIAQLTDSTARYVCGMLDLDQARAASLLQNLASAVAVEWRPTFLQINVGTLFPFIVDGLNFDKGVEFRADAIYSSLVFEGSRLNNVTIARGSFVNISFRNVEWSDVTFSECELGEISVDVESAYDHVRIVDCHLGGVRIFQEDDEIAREYSPDRVVWQLRKLGIDIEQADAAPEVVEAFEESDFYKLVHRTLRMFYRTTIVHDEQITRRFRQDHATVLDRVLPLLERHGVVDERPWRGSGTQTLWAITCRIDDVFAAEGDAGVNPQLAKFWDEVRKTK